MWESGGHLAYVISSWPAAVRAAVVVRLLVSQCCGSQSVVRRVSCAADDVRSSMELLGLRCRLVCGICQLWIL